MVITIYHEATSSAGEASRPEAPSPAEAKALTSMSDVHPNRGQGRDRGEFQTSAPPSSLMSPVLSRALSASSTSSGSSVRRSGAPWDVPRRSLREDGRLPPRRCPRLSGTAVGTRPLLYKCHWAGHPGSKDGSFQIGPFVSEAAPLLTLLSNSSLQALSRGHNGELSDSPGTAGSKTAPRGDGRGC